MFAGSFDPFTIGHLEIVRVAERMFDETHVVIGVNVQKKRMFDIDAMEDAIRECCGKSIIVSRHSGLMTDYAREQGIEWYVRGLRNGQDYAYEENIAAVNAMLMPGLQTVYLRSTLPCVSSSTVRELLAFHHDVSAFLPPSVLKLVKP